MNILRPFQRRRRGFALITVVVFIAVMAILTASMLRYSASERRLNERNRLVLRARNMAENAALYASEQITTKLYRLRSTSRMAFMTGSNRIYPLPDNVTTTAYSAPSDVEVKAGLTTSTGLQFVDPLIAANANNPNVGLSVSTSTVPIIAKATMHHPVVGDITAYAEQDLQIAMIPLFQFAVFYNMDMEFGPGPTMIINGPVHTNGNLIARIQTGMTNTLQFTERVTAAGGFYANTAYKGKTYMGDGSADNGPGGSGPLNFQNPAGTVANIKNSSGVWRDYLYGTTTETANTRNQFRTFATSTYGGNLRTSVHGVTRLELPSIGGYKEVDDPSTDEDETKNGRQIIEPPSGSDTADLVQAKMSRRSGLYVIVNPAGNKPDGSHRQGILPNGVQVPMVPQSYRCFLNTVNADGSYSIVEVVLPGQPAYGFDDNGTPSNPADDKMYKNNLPNRYTDLTAIGSNQVLRIPNSNRSWESIVSTPTPITATTYTSAGLTTKTGYPLGDDYFYDLRRGDGSNSYPFNRPGSNFVPRPIYKIDFDMTRFRLAVERTLNDATTSSSIFNPNDPRSSSGSFVSNTWTGANWSNSVLNPSATTTTYKLGVNTGTHTDYGDFPASATTLPYFVDPYRIYYAPPNPTDPLITTNPSTFAVSAASLVDVGGACPWFDGITAYVHSVDAEDKTRTGTVLNRVDSGVRLWNGRGPLVSLSSASYPGRTGFSFASNDAVYIVGHFNADGNVNATTTSTGVGGYSGRYPESANEMLCAVMGDAITILSAPEFVRSGSSPNYNYAQSKGWCDSLSKYRRSSSGYSTSWATTNPSGSNSVDGLSSPSIAPARAPNLTSIASANAGVGSTMTQKPDPAETEISTCLLTGIVHTTNAQASGGVHNFPRLLENWGGTSPATGLYIRGSMVAMFESQVATEPWSIRYYQGAGRYWGLHQNLRAENGAHDLPLEPIVLNAQRVRYREVSPTEYAAEKALIESLPH